MPPKLRRSFSGAFLARERGNGAWQLSRPPPHETEVFLRGAEHGARRVFATGPMVDLGIEWRGENVLLTFTSEGTVASVATASAIVHEPLSRLYERLPMLSIDSDARRFWRKVFCLARLPGGRYLLKIIARSRRR
jgi:hypothetical protein